MYIGIPSGKDSQGEFFGPCLRTDSQSFSPTYGSHGTIGQIIGAGTHSFDTRAVVRVLIMFAAGVEQCLASMQWLEGLCAGLFHTYKHDARTQSRDIVRVQRVLCPRIFPRFPTNPSDALGFTGANIQILQTEGPRIRQRRKTDKSILGCGETFEVNYKEITKQKTIGYDATLELFKCIDRSSCLGNTLAILIPNNLTTRLHDAGVTTVHIQSAVSKQFHPQNYANLSTATAAENPLYENAGNFTVWISPRAEPRDLPLDGCFLQIPVGRITQDGNVWRKTDVHRAAIALTIIDCCADRYPVSARKMRVAARGVIDTDEEKEWMKELREWRATNLPTVPSDSSVAGEPETTVHKVYLMRGPAKVTTNPKEMWAMHLAQSKIPRTRPEASLGTSTELDWNAFVRKLGDDKNTVREWVDDLDHDFEGEPYKCECEKELTDANLTTMHYFQDGPATCTRKAFDAIGIAGDHALGDTHTIFYCQVKGCLWGMAWSYRLGMASLLNKWRDHLGSAHLTLDNDGSAVMAMLNPPSRCCGTTNRCGRAIARYAEESEQNIYGTLPRIT